MRRLGDKPLLPHPRERRALSAEERILRHLQRHPEGVDTPLLRAWLAQCRRTVYSFKEVEAALHSVLRSGRAHVANRLWYLRSSLPPTPNPDAHKTVSSPVPPNQLALFAQRSSP